MKSHLLATLVATLSVVSGQDASSQKHSAATHDSMVGGSGRRVWTTPDGGLSGSLHGVRGSEVRLRLEGGSFKVVALDRLKAADRAEVARWQNANQAPAGFGKPEVTLTVETLRGQMRYDLAELQVQPGVKVELILHNLDDMHHNLILCAPGEGNRIEVAKAAWALGGDGFAKQWIPQHPKLLQASPMVDPHSTRHVYFVAPLEMGDYPYVCTLPGHAAFMKGVLKVRSKPQDLSELTYTLYHGDFGNMPDFATLTPVGTDHVSSGLVDLSVAKRRDGFAVVFDGLLNVPKDGVYRFDLSSDDGSQLRIDGQLVIDNDGVHAAIHKRGKAQLSEGRHRLQVAYFEQGGEEQLSLAWSGPGFKNHPLSSESPQSRRREVARGMPLVPMNNEARIYRNFIDGAGNRAIGVGYPSGINLAFDADKMRIARIWLGGFMDAARHWTGRGSGHQPPLGYGEYRGPEAPPFAELASADESWPEAKPRAGGYTFKGYTLMKQGRQPMFTYQFGDHEVCDYLSAQGDVKSDDARINRKIFIRSNPLSPPPLYFLAARAPTIEVLSHKRFLLDSGVIITLGSDTFTAKPILRDADQGSELILPVTFKDVSAGIATIEQTFHYQLTAE